MNINIDEKESSAILAGLRLLQMHKGFLPPAIDRIYTNEDEHAGLSVGEIDILCEKINVPVD